MARERMKKGNYPVVWVTNNTTRYLVSNVLLHNQCEATICQNTLYSSQKQKVFFKLAKWTS